MWLWAFIPCMPTILASGDLFVFGREDGIIIFTQIDYILKALMRVCLFIRIPIAFEVTGIMTAASHSSLYSGLCWKGNSLLSSGCQRLTYYCLVWILTCLALRSFVRAALYPCYLTDTSLRVLVSSPVSAFSMIPFHCNQFDLIY